jgi:hypothetical protein
MRMWERELPCKVLVYNHDFDCFFAAPNSLLGEDFRKFLCELDDLVDDLQIYRFVLSGSEERECGESPVPILSPKLWPAYSWIVLSAGLTLPMISTYSVE